MFGKMKRLLSGESKGLGPDFTGPFALARVANTPLLVTPSVGQMTLNFLLKREGVQALTPLAAYDNVGDEKYYDLDQRYNRERGNSFHREESIAVIPVEGTLVHKLRRMDTYCGMMGYDGIARKLRDAAADPTIRGIILDFDTPGGETRGCAATAKLIQEIGAIKPVWAMIDEMAYSAGCWLASACTRVYAAATANTGSIGVVMMHADFSVMLKSEGIAVTLIHGGAHKVDGNPYEPLPEAVRATFQKEVEDLRLLFATAVAEGRKISVDAVLATEARTLTATEALEMGLIDGIAEAEHIVKMFLDDLNGVKAAPVFVPRQVASPDAPVEPVEPDPTDDDSHDNEKDEDMTTPAAAAPAASQPAAGAAGAGDQPAAGAAAPAPVQPAAGAQPNPLATAKAIMELPEAKGREGLAQQIAFGGKLSVDEAKAMLAAAPTAAAKDPLGAAMSAIDQPNLGPGADESEKPTGDAAKYAEDLNPASVYGRYNGTAKK